MSKQFYVWTRDLHLYIGLVVSPFVILFAVSVILLNHTWIPLGGSGVLRQTTSAVQIPQGLENLDGMARVDGIKEILRQIGVAGEVNFVTFLPKEHRLVVPVVKPGQLISVNIDLDNHTATAQLQKTGFWDALIYLHKTPGPHVVAIRGNWIYTRVWRFFADAVVYTILFISASGIYLWAVLKAERKIGLILLGAGALSFMGAIYAIAL